MHATAQDGCRLGMAWEYIDPHLMQSEGDLLTPLARLHGVSGVGQPLRRNVGGPRGSWNPQGMHRHEQAPFGRRRAFTDSFKCLPSCFDDECGVDLGDDWNGHFPVSHLEPDDEVAVLFEPQQGERKMFTIAFDRSHGVSLGLDVECSQGATTLPIIAVKKVGLAAHWNRLNPEKVVAVGDEMLQVNGIRHNVEQMMALCKSARYLEVVLARGRHGPRQDSFGASVPLGQIPRHASFGHFGLDERLPGLGLQRQGLLPSVSHLTRQDGHRLLPGLGQAPREAIYAPFAGQRGLLPW